MESQDHHQALIKGHAKPLCFSQSQDMIAVAQASNEFLLINKYDPSEYFRVPTGKTDKTLSLKLTDKLLVRAGTQGTVTLWDSRELRNNASIHTFNRPGCKFNALDVSEFILAGGTSKRIVFWDLRKMKQRHEFTESFNEDVTALQFSKDISTIFYAATYDGLIAKFDLTEKNEEDAFVWGHQIIESPCYLQNSGNMTLIQTQDQMLLTLQQESVKDKFTVSNVDNPRHILSSHLNTQRQIVYYTKHMKKGTVEYWHGQTNMGYLPIARQFEMFVPLSEEKVLYADEKGSWYFERVHKGKAHKNLTVNQDFLTVEELQSNVGKQQKSEVNQNGFIVNKPSSLKNSSKKFKPY